MLRKVFTVKLCLLLLMFLPTDVVSQSASAKKERAQVGNIGQDANLENFLQEDKELREIYESRFTGQFMEISRSVQDRLDKAFPKYRFRIAEMELLTDLPWKKTKLVVITNRKSNEVSGFVWGGMWTMPSKSFKKLVYGDIVKSSDKATAKPLAIAELLAETGSLKVGKTLAEPKYIEVEILTMEDSSIFRKLRLEIMHGNKLGKFLILRQDGKRIVGPENN